MSYNTTPIYSFPFVPVGLSGVTRTCTWSCTDSLATVTGAGYINPIIALGHPVFANDVFAVTYKSGTSPVFGYFTPLISATGIVTLLPVVQGNVIRLSTAFAFGQLSTAGTVLVLASSGVQSYQPVDIKLAGVTGTNFSGGSGNRNLALTDGTNVFTVIPAATLGTLTNSVWGSTAVPAPASVSFGQASAAGANLTLAYSGGTNDYTAGSAVLLTTWQRVA